MTICLLPFDNTMLSPASSRKLRARLPHGYAAEVARRMKGEYTPKYIYMVANGLRNNDQIVAELLRLIQDRKEIANQLQKAIDEL